MSPQSKETDEIAIGHCCRRPDSAKKRPKRRRVELLKTLLLYLSYPSSLSLPFLYSMRPVGIRKSREWCYALLYQSQFLLSLTSGLGERTCSLHVMGFIHNSWNPLRGLRAVCFWCISFRTESSLRRLDAIGSIWNP